MAGFLYFIPGVDKLAPAQLPGLGLGHVDAARGIMTGQVRGGPGGSNGLLLKANLADGRREPAVMYKPDAQAWRKGMDGLYWVGSWNDRRPEPEDLARERFIAGERLKLLDGREWTVPICRSIVRGSTLPKRLVLGEDCRSWEMRDLPEFAALCADAEQVFEAFRNAKREDDGSSELSIKQQDAVRICIAALGVNYRVGPVEVDQLGLLTTDGVWSILRAIVDDFTVERVSAELQKKSSPSGS